MFIQYLPRPTCCNFLESRHDTFALTLCAVSIESETVDGEEGTLVLLMDPGVYRHLEETVKSETQAWNS